MTYLEGMSRTPTTTTTNEIAAQGGESVDVRETETPEGPSGRPSTPETPASTKRLLARVHQSYEVSHAVCIACSRPYYFFCHSRPNLVIG